MNRNTNIALFFIICLAMTICIFLLHKHYTDEDTTRIINKNLIPYIHDAKNNLRVNKKSVPGSSQGIEYNINFWMFINDYKYRLNEDKVIIQKGDYDFNPSIVLQKNTNNLKIIIHTDYFSNESGNESGNETESENESELESNIEEFVVKNIKIQKWVNVNINLIDNSLDVFIDGKLVSSFIVNGYTKINNGDLNICPNGGFNGYLTKLTYTNKSYNPKKIYTIYKTGPN